jgi:hypothetical protein
MKVFLKSQSVFEITMNVYDGTLRALQCACRKRVEQPDMHIVPPTKMLEAISLSTKTLEDMW